MNTSPVTVNRNLVLLARALDRLERSGDPVDPDQFRAVVARLTAELDATPRDAFPVVAELYENLNYAHAGLCRAALDAALAAELAARTAIDAARRTA